MSAMPHPELKHNCVQWHEMARHGCLPWIPICSPLTPHPVFVCNGVEEKRRALRGKVEAVCAVGRRLLKGAGVGNAQAVG